MKKKGMAWSKWLLLAGMVVLAAVLVLWLWPGEEAPAQGAEKKITVVVTHGDGSEKTVDIHTRMENLGDALLEQELAQGEEGPYGLYIKTVDGERVDDGKAQWWCLTKGGESVMTGADLTPIADGDQFELTFKEGY